jgi:hypothetical protein
MPLHMSNGQYHPAPLLFWDARRRTLALTGSHRRVLFSYYQHCTSGEFTRPGVGTPTFNRGCVR